MQGGVGAKPAFVRGRYLVANGRRVLSESPPVNRAYHRTNPLGASDGRTRGRRLAPAAGLDPRALAAEIRRLYGVCAPAESPEIESGPGASIAP